jgi:large conductance mechanosensitive channel
MGFIQEFKAFAMRGNVIDMAVGIVIGGAFGKIVSSLVADIIMPPVGAITGGIDFRDLSLTIKEATTNAAGEAVAAVTINYGSFINTIIDFTIIAFAIFMVIKLMNTAKRKQEAASPPPARPSNEEVLLGEIRDLLKARA